MPIFELQKSPKAQEDMQPMRENVPSSSDKRVPESHKRVQELFPGIPDDITLNHISVKLSWKAYRILATVSSTWRQAIQSRLVYDTRVRHQSLETLVIHSHSTGDRDYEALCLYSLRDECCYKLPGIPWVARGIPHLCTFIALGSKIYVLGGVLVKDDCRHQPAYGNLSSLEEVFVLDVGTGRKWEKCADKPSGRVDFGCGVLDGKIYVFEHPKHGKLDSGSEVYDPKTNSWSKIMPIPSLESDGFSIVDHSPRGDRHFRVHHRPRVDALGEELFVHVGYSSGMGSTYICKVYHPGKNEWRTERFLDERRLDDTWRFINGAVVMAEGKFNMITDQGILVRDSNNLAWEDLHSILYAGFRPSVNTSFRIYRAAAPAVLNDELFGIVMAAAPISNFQTLVVECLGKYEEFRSDKRVIVCHALNCRRENFKNLGDFICAIQL